MEIILNNKIEISASPEKLSVIEKKFIFSNPKYYAARQMRYSVRNISPIVDLTEQTENGLIVPIGALDWLLKKYPESNEIDNRMLVPVEIPFNGKLRPYQEKFVDDAIQSGGGVMVAATGSGKTVSGIALAAKLGQRALILVKSKDLAKQWQEAIQQFTGLKAGLVGGGQNTEGKQFTVGIIQTLVKRDLSSMEYGLLIADECHNAPANQFYQVISSIHSKYKFGLSATPQRRDNLEFMIHAALGSICAEIKTDDLNGKVLPVIVKPVRCGFFHPVNSWNGFLKVLAEDERRNRMIVDMAVQQDKPTIILCGHVKHCEMLTEIAQEAGLAPLLVHGQLNDKTRKARMEAAAESRLIIGTASLLSEGIDWPHLSVLIFAAPMSAVINKANPAATKLIQSIGRCRRPYPGKTIATVIDIVDVCGFGISAFNKRKHIYQLHNFKMVA